MIVHSDVIRMGFCDHDLAYLVRKINKIQKSTTMKQTEIRNFQKLIAEIPFRIWKTLGTHKEALPVGGGGGGGGGPMLLVWMLKCLGRCF